MFDYAMDLGTSSVLLYREGKGILLREPSVVAMQRSSGAVISAGKQARDMLGRTPEEVVTLRPVRGGVVTDCGVTGAMARLFLKRAGAGRVLRPNLLICVPPLVSELEERAAIDVGLQAGAARVYLMEQPVAAAFGAGVDPDSPKGTLIVDIGGGTTDIAVISMGAVVCASSVRTAGDRCDEAIAAYLRQSRDLLVGISTAEELKCTMGGVLPREEPEEMTVRGRRASTGLPVCETVTAAELLPVLRAQAEELTDAIRALLAQAPPELVGDLTETGIVLAGGGSRLYGMADYLEQDLGLETHLSDDPEACVILGTRRALGNLKRLREGPMNLARRRQGLRCC